MNPTKPSYKVGDFVVLRAIPEENVSEETVEIFSFFGEDSQFIGYGGVAPNGDGTQGECGIEQIVRIA